MNIVRFDPEKHYPVMKKLWEELEWPPCPEIALPNESYVAESTTGELIAYLGMYMQPAKIGFFAWALTNRKWGAACGVALCRLVDRLVETAKENKCHFIYGAAKAPSWQRILLSKGLSVAEQGADTFIMALSGEDITFFQD